MITDDYVSFEMAKLLKKKGFDGPCYKVWESYGGSQTLVGAPSFVEGETVVNRELVDAAAKQYVYEYSIINNNVEGYLAPTLQMAMKWLREVHNLFICLLFMEDNGEYAYTVDNVKERSFSASAKNITWPTYEEACEAGIKYCLENLI